MERTVPKSTQALGKAAINIDQKMPVINHAEKMIHLSFGLFSYAFIHSVLPMKVLASQHCSHF